MGVNHVAQGQLVINVFLKYFYQYNGVQLTDQQLYAKILNYDSSKFLQTLGSAFSQGLDEDRDKLESAMDYVASGSVGGYPTTQSFFDAMYKENSTISLIKEVAEGTASDIASGLSSFGDNMLMLVKFLNTALPFIIIGGIGYFLYKNKELLDLKDAKFIKDLKG